MTDRSNSGRLEAQARRYRALGDPSRLRIIEALRETGEPLSVRDLAGRIGLR